MKHSLWLAPLVLLVLTSGNAFADSITRIGLNPNDGSGDNFGFLQSGNGLFVAVGGGVPYDFFNVNGYAPGSTLGGSTDVFYTGGVIRFGGNSYDLGFCCTGTLFLSSITLPTNGKDFTAWVQIDFSGSAIILATGQSIDLEGSAFGTIKFNYINGTYLPLGFVEAPEPDTLGLMGIGLIGIFTLARRRFAAAN
jgi:hypothetical protein